MLESTEKTIPELHLLIVWHNGRTIKDAMRADLANRMEIVAQWELEWTAERFAANLRRFYGKNLPPRSSKELECGIGPFSLFILRDNHPIYSPRKTTHGVQIVNAVMFDAKEMYRAWARQNVVHATNSPQEFRHDITLLTGMSPEDLAANGFSLPPESRRPGFDIAGTHGWANVRQMLYLLNHTLNYVVLRNFDNLPDRVDLGPHSDLDLLTDDKEVAALLLNAVPTTSVRGRVQHRVQVGESYLNVDIRHVGDGYYDAPWEHDILVRRRFWNQAFYVPDGANTLYSLVYHALIHKSAISLDYPERILKLCDEIGVPPIKLTDEVQALDCLRQFMAERKYAFVDPKDPSVTFNYFKVGAKARFIRKKQHIVRQLKSFGKTLLGK